MSEKTAKQVLCSMLRQDALEGRITPVEHQDAFDRLNSLEEGHDILYYINKLCQEN